MMATTSVLEPKPRHIFARRFLELVIPPKIKQPTPNLLDSQNLAMFFYTELSEISEIVTNSLYLSGCSPVTSDNLESLGITAIVCALSENEERRMMPDRALPEHVKKMHVRLIDADFSDISVHFDSAAQFIDEEIKNGGRVLLHCAAGISRSATLTMAYLMKYRNYDLRKAFNLVKSSRRVVRPNNGFFQKLIDYERSIYGDEHAPSVQMVKHSEDENEEESRLIPDVVLEHAKRVDVNDWRHLA
jgi:protein-tyrosine phosphatase